MPLFQAVQPYVAGLYQTESVLHQVPVEAFPRVEWYATAPSSSPGRVADVTGLRRRPHVGTASEFEPPPWYVGTEVLCVKERATFGRSELFNPLIAPPREPMLASSLPPSADAPATTRENLELP